MSATLPAHLPATMAPAAPAAPAVLHRIAAAFRAWRDARRTLAAIDELDDATLRDIGIDRAELRMQRRADREGWRGAWGRI